MKKIMLIVVLFFSIQPIFSQNWQLVWSDEFSGSTLNSDHWTRETGGHGWGNNELQYYTDREANAFVQNGILTIKAIQENYGGRDYTSARLITQGKVFYQYGKVEARIRLPYGQGIWPAFWMLGESFSTIGWPACGEIDIMEMVGGSGDNTIHGTIHYEGTSGYATTGSHTSLASGIFADDFHVFSIEWNTTHIKWFLDGQQYFSVDISADPFSEFHEDFFLLLNVAVGGNWPGPPDGTTVFPQTMEVDYVRIYHDMNQVPSVSITSPISGSDLTAGSILTITAEASDNDGYIESVQFFQGAGLLGETSSEPYQIELQNIQPGSYSITANAVDNSGVVSTSDLVTFTVAGGSEQAPYLIQAAQIPGIIEAENYDIGGEGVAYHDGEAGNLGSAYRSEEGVDIEELGSGDGMNVGWTGNGEWIEYTVNVEHSGQYTLQTTVASESGGGAYYFQMGGQTIVGSNSVPSTGGWQNWTTLSHTVSLTAGIQVLRFNVIQEGFNFDNMTFISFTGIEDISPAQPVQFRLEQNYPNPFNPSTVISYNLPVNSIVDLTVYNSMGQKIATLVKQNQSAGFYSVRWNAGHNPAGVYFYQLKAGAYSKINKMVLLK